MLDIKILIFISNHRNSSELVINCQNMRKNSKSSTKTAEEWERQKVDFWTTWKVSF